MTEVHDADDDDDAGFDPACHRHAVPTLRLILAELTDNGAELTDDIDTDRDIIVAEVDDCPDCWRGIATRAVFYAACYMRLWEGEDEAIADIQRQLAGTLDGDRS